MSQNIRPATSQHTVTRRLLKEFTDADGRVAVFDRKYRQRRRLTTGAGIFTTNFDSYDSRGTEDLWNLFESRFPAALQCVHRGTALDDPEIVDVLKDMLALHWARSRGMSRAREEVANGFLEGYRRINPGRHPERLAQAFRQRTGLVASSQSELEWINEKIVEEFKLNELAGHHSRKNADFFAAARNRFANLKLQIRYSQGSDLAIGDSPVLTTIKGRVGAGPHQGVGILKADQIAMPLTPTRARRPRQRTSTNRPR